MNEIPIEEQHPEPVAPPSVWQENHGNLLLAFVAAIVLIGSGILAYRQFRFVPPEFPGPRAFADPASAGGSAQVVTENSVVIRVLGAANNAGEMLVAIYDSPETYGDLEQAALAGGVTIADGEARLIVDASALPERMVIAAYHDENGDGELNRNRLGIPTERYGFSRNARGLTGPPGFETAEIPRPAAGTEIEIYVR